MSVSAQRTSLQSAAIHPATAIGTVRLTVADLARSREFYERMIGLHANELDDGTLALGLGASGEHPLIELRADRGARGLDPEAPGLFHLAILLPARGDLAHALARLVEARWPLEGASDHLVSEALYLSDPDGNGIETYHDRPREEWPRTGGAIQMATTALDLEDLLAEIAVEGAPQRLAPFGTRIGHVHLQVSDLDRAEDFYSRVLGFAVTVRRYPGALFVSAGGYHHHLGLNTWRSTGASPAPPRSIGLRSYDVRLPDAAELQRVLERVRAAGIETGACQAR